MRQKTIFRAAKKFAERIITEKKQILQKLWKTSKNEKYPRFLGGMHKKTFSKLYKRPMDKMKRFFYNKTNTSDSQIGEPNRESQE